MPATKKNKKSVSKPSKQGSVPDKQSEVKSGEEKHCAQPLRETVESVVVAIILALLFRAFVAEAFVIPTGSMAPTLMGTHKDLECPYCGINYRTGASEELPDRSQQGAVVGSACPNCYADVHLDLSENPNHATFSGDRILVSKFSYSLGSPKRFDVGVFKNPHNAKQNYIKRIVGLPSETIRISNGDLYVKPDGAEQFAIARKDSLRKLLSMSHLVHDSRYQSKPLLESGFPTRWQPWDKAATEPPNDSWLTTADSNGMTAKFNTPGDDLRWLRYFHNYADNYQWEQALAGKSLENVSPYQYRAVTDAYAYNAILYTAYRSVYDDRGRLNPSYDAAMLKSQHQDMSRKMGNHWVGDLLMDIDLETEPGEGTVALLLIRAGVEYRCDIALDSGEATLRILDGDQAREFSPSKGASATERNAQTSLRSGMRTSIRYSNFDDQLRLWIEGSEVQFNAPTTYDSRSFRTRENDRPYWTVDNPLDAAPLAIGVSGVGATLHHARVLRDKYYSALPKRGGAINEYVPSENPERVARLMQSAERWNDTSLWESRRQTEYELTANQYFPLGDNSPSSADARGWTGAHFVPRDLLVGKAVFVFWPHTWNTPVPFTPNLKRMKFIH